MAQKGRGCELGGLKANDGHFYLDQLAFNMASLVEVTEALRSLQEMFRDLDAAVVNKVYTDYKDHQNQFDAAVTELLTIHAVKEQAIQDADQSNEPVDEASSEGPSPVAFEQVGLVFPDLSRSVIGGALFQNQGQVAGAIELLINIGQDKDAIAQIRDMNPEKKAEVRVDSSISTFLRGHSRRLWSAISLPAFWVPTFSSSATCCPPARPVIPLLARITNLYTLFPWITPTLRLSNT